MTKICYTSDFIWSFQYNTKSPIQNSSEINSINVINPYLNKTNKNNNNNKNNDKNWVRNYNKEPNEEMPKVGKNAWFRTESQSEYDKFEKTVKGILNKLTREKFDKLSNDICTLDISNINILKCLSNLIFNKALEVYSFADMYIDLCYKIHSNWVKIDKLNHIVYTVYNLDNEKWYWTYKYNDITSINDETTIYGPFFTKNKILSFISNSFIENKSTFEISNTSELDLDICNVYIQNCIIYTLFEDKKTSKFFFKKNKELYYSNNVNNTIYGNPSPLDSSIDATQTALNFISFRKLIVNNVQSLFMKGITIDKPDIDSNLSQADEDELILKEKQKRICNIYLIAELFKKQIISEKVIHECICLLLHVFININKNIVLPNSNLNTKYSSDNDIEYLCKLLTEIGSFFDKNQTEDLEYISSQQNKVIEDFDQSKISIFGQYIWYLENLVDPSRKIVSPRIRFMVKDLIDCRKNNWVERRQKVKSSTLKEVRDSV